MLEKSTNRIDIMLMRRSAVIPVLVLLTCMIVPAPGATRVMVQDFEKISVPPTVWVVHIPNENASVLVSADQSRDGQKCLKLHYRFVGTGDFQYLGIPNKVRIKSPVHKLRFWLKGDNSKCSYGVQVSDASGETHQYSKNTGQGGIIDFAGWKEVVIDLDSGHETWGGDKNGRTDYPGRPEKNGRRSLRERRAGPREESDRNHRVRERSWLPCCLSAVVGIDGLRSVGTTIGIAPSPATLAGDVSMNTNELDDAAKSALPMLGKEHGAVSREIQPPKR